MLMDAKVVNRLLPRDPDEETVPGGISQYQERVGHYQWAANTTHPDIVRGMAKLGEFSTNPSAVYEKKLKHLDRYIQETREYELVLERLPDICCSDGEHTVYTDTSYADDSTQKGTSSVLIND